jgi:hypothetical protein
VSKDIVAALRESGHISNEQMNRWAQAAPMLAALEAIGRDGANALVKFDGQRQDKNFTVVLTGPRFGESFFRCDGDDLLALLRDAIEDYRSKGWP